MPCNCTTPECYCGAEPVKQYEAGDCIAVEIGEITLRDGRKVQGVVLTFPVRPPSLPISVVWDEEPLRLERKMTRAELCGPGVDAWNGQKNTD